jgi:signal transduction histidine kinase
MSRPVRSFSAGGPALAVLVVVADTALLATAHRGLPPWTVGCYAAAVCLAVAFGRQSPLAAFLAALCLAALTGQSYVLLLWAAYQAGYRIASARGTAIAAGGAAGVLALQLASRASDPQQMSALVSVYVVFVALPALTGRYLAQHRRLVTALDQRNRRLRREQELLADRERLRERLRIARDMHDSLGHRLSLVSIQAAALEVTVPAPHGEAVRRLACAARDTLDELHGLVGSLRGEDDPPPALESIDDLVAGFRAAGSPVILRRSGNPRPLTPEAARAAYRVAQEALTNAARHAPGLPVALTLAWEPDTLLLTAANPLPAVPSAAGPSRGGSGLSGLAERVQAAGGFLDHRSADGEFRLVAMVPADATLDATADPALGRPDAPLTGGRVRMLTLGTATAALMLVVLPATMLFGVH